MKDVHAADAQSMASLRGKVLHGVGWRTGSDISQMVLQVAFTAVLARLLSRADFGIIAMALMFNRFVTTLMRLGLGSAIIQSQDITPSQVSGLFSIQVAIALASSIVCHIAAPVGVAVFHQPDLVPVIRALTWTIFLSSFNFPSILLQKALCFAPFSILEMVSMFISNVIGILLAWNGFGMWALVWRAISGALISAVGIWPLARWWPVWPAFRGLKPYLAYGVHMQASNILNYFSQNLAAIIAGRYIGVETLGSFNIAYNLAITPAQKIQSVLSSVLLSAYSAMKQNQEELVEYFTKSLFLVAVPFVPLMVGLSAVGPDLVTVLYSAKWREAGFLLAFLAVVGMLKGLEHLMRSVILASGRASAVSKVTMAETMVSVPLLYMGAQWLGGIGLVIAHLSAAVVSFHLNVRNTHLALRGPGVFLRATRHILLAAALMFVVMRAAGLFMSWRPAATLAAQVLLGGLAYSFALLCLLDDNERRRLRGIPGVEALIGRILTVFSPPRSARKAGAAKRQRSSHAFD